MTRFIQTRCKPVFLSIWGILAGILLQASAYSQDTRIRKLDSLFSQLDQQQLLNGNILIAEGGQILYERSLGFENLETGQRLSKKSIFELASLSKQFTAVSILQLVQAKKIGLDDSLRHFFPALPYQGITIRHLLNHTGGEPDYFELIEQYWDKSKIIDNSGMIRLMEAHPLPVQFAPGEKWEYSNTGYMLLASIIEKVSGKPYGKYLQDNIFKPLGMKHSFVYTRRFHPKKVPHYAYGYIHDDSLQRWVLPDSLPETKFVVYADGIIGDGCVNSTAKDLLIWDQALYTNKIIKQELLQEAFQPTRLSTGAIQNYGYGWGLYENPVYGKVVNHSGGWPGYMTWIFRYIDKNKTIIILCNKMLPLKGLTNAVEHILFNEAFEPPTKR